MNPKVDAYISKSEQWAKEIKALRKILLDCGLTEEVKWGKPCYTSEGKNICVIQDFKQYFALLFFKGYLLSDPEKLLLKTGQNTVVGRQFRFDNAKQITEMAPIIKSYIFEAIEAEKSGIELPKEKRAEHPMPEELEKKLKKDTKLKKAFQALTPGRQRAYIIHINQAKQVATRESRVDKVVPLILAGKGLND
jgi:uncharacterized protein YdeI (YjbR/CyaY-like superfamily)